MTQTLLDRGDGEAPPGVQEAASEHSGGAEADITEVRTHCTLCREAEEAVRLSDTRSSIPTPHTWGLTHPVIPTPAQVLVTPVLAILNAIWETFNFD